LGLQLVPSIIENIAPYDNWTPSTESLDPPLIYDHYMVPKII
jgi:hypothetical protein